MFARGAKIFVAPGEHGFSFFQVKIFTRSVSVLLTSSSLKIILHLIQVEFFVLFLSHVKNTISEPLDFKLF